jgi:hypothetical protein
VQIELFTQDGPTASGAAKGDLVSTRQRLLRINATANLLNLLQKQHLPTSPRSSAGSEKARSHLQPAGGPNSRSWRAGLSGTRSRRGRATRPAEESRSSPRDSRRCWALIDHLPEALSARSRPDAAERVGVVEPVEYDNDSRPHHEPACLRSMKTRRSAKRSQAQTNRMSIVFYLYG